jgi:uncharacterized membrane protein
MNRDLFTLLSLPISALIWLATCCVLPARAQGPAVHAVLFYSPTCPHCHQVISENLPPLFDKYGDRLQIIGLDISQPGGQALYQAAIERYGIPEERRGVPTLIVGDVVLVGSLEIPQQLPDLVENYLAQGGVDWPDIPGLAELLAADQPTPAATAVQPTPPSAPSPTPPATSTQTPPPTHQAIAFPANPPNVTPTPAPTLARTVLMVTDGDTPGWLANLARDPDGNALAIVTLLGMVLAVSSVLVARPRAAGELAMWQSWAIPLLALVGLGVAGYLAYVETQQVAAVCGPVGECNTVQQSPYACLFGLLPIGVLGLLGYATILIAWGMARFGRGPLAGLAWPALLAMTVFGTLFSIYLTFLEPFVIGATCAWCLTSAIVMTALLALTTAPGKHAISTLLQGKARRPALDEGTR